MFFLLIMGKAPFFFLCFLPLLTVTRASHRPHHRSHTVHRRSGRQLPQRQISLPSPFFFSLPSLSVIAACEPCNMNYNSRCTVSCNLVTRLPVTKLLRVGPVLAQPVPKIKSNMLVRVRPNLFRPMPAHLFSAHLFK
jgi:hypothetical protein